MNEEDSCGNPIVVVDVVISVVADLLELADKVPGEVHVGHVREERDVVHEKPVLMEENLLFDVWGELIGQGFNLHLQE